jgi:L,D-transpeptidase YcbB
VRQQPESANAPRGTGVAWVVALAVFVAASGAPRLHAASNSGETRDDSVRVILRESAHAGVLAGLKWPRFPDYKDQLEGLYARSNGQPVWSVAGKPTPEARTAIEMLGGAAERGLHSEDYDAALLARRFDELTKNMAATARDVAWFDVALSVGFLRHVSDVHIGRVNPKTLGVGINVEPKRTAFTRELKDALDHGGVAEIVRDAEPRYVQYRNLKTACNRYRSLAARPEPPAIAAPSAMRAGDAFAGAPALRRRLAILGDLGAADADAPRADSVVYDSATARAVMRFQGRHGLSPDGVLGPATLAAINVPLAQRERQLELALERIRWLPTDVQGPFLIVNVPAFTLYAFDSLNSAGVPSMAMNVVVGKAEVGRQTPIFERDMKYIVFRPYWVIPRNIIRKETLPAIRHNPGYLKQNQLEIYSGSGDSGSGLPATSENLDRVARGELGMRQRPGPQNSLGLAKFIFPNDHDVYMHGTPATELFSRARRDFSHGCIRLEDPARLAVWVLRDPVKWSPDAVRRAMDGEPSKAVNLPQKLPVVIYYTTAAVRADGTVMFYDDVYGHDSRLLKALARGYPFAR